jgi:thiol:disulfide interchange protein DsbD
LTLGLVIATASARGQSFLDGARKLFRVQVSQSAQSVPSGGALDVVLAFDVDEGIHIYTDRERLRVEWEEATGANFVELVLPATRAIPDLLTEGATVDVLEGKFEIRARFRVTAVEGETVRIRGKVHYQGCTDQTCYPPLDTAIDITAKVSDTASPAEASPTPAQPKAKPPTEGGFLWNLLWAFGWGILISFTPCVYPIIPITVSILGSRREGSKTALFAAALVHVLGLSLTYAVVGLLVATVGNAVRAFLASPWFLVPLATLFVAFALSMFDVITIQVPQSVGGKLQKLTGTPSGAPTGLIGVFLMGIVAGIVAGPCVAGPVAAVLGYVAKSADLWRGFWMLFALGWGMGLILIAAGVSTSLLPKAGGWMVGVKHFLGFVMLWAAAYFLAPAVISSRVYTLIAALLLIAAPVFLGCFDQLTAESGFALRLRRVLGILAVVYGAYLGVTTVAELEGRTLVGSAAAEKAESPFRYATPEQVDQALKSGRPVIVDITADYCVVCKKLERDVYADPRVVAAARPFTALTVDVGRWPELGDRLKTFPPALVFFDAKGNRVETADTRSLPNELERLTPDRFAEILSKVEAHIRKEAE